MRIAILQAPAPDFSRAEEGWQALLSRIDDAAQDGPQLIVLPEASYPAWFLGHAASASPVLTDGQLLADLGQKARQYGIYIAAGLVLGRPHATKNSAVLIAPDGLELARATESNPAPWFHRGDGPAAVTIPEASLALFAGSDSLDPRWVEALAEARTQLVVATGASRGWRAAISDGEPITSEPVEAIMTTRASETGAWFAVAGRTGIEGDSVGYAGGAGIVAPRDGWLVRAPADRPGIVLYECELTVPRPDAHVALTYLAPAGSPPFAAPESLRIATLSLDPTPSVVDLMEAVRASMRAAAMLGATLIVLPDLTGADPHALTRAETQPFIEATSAELHLLVVAASAERVGNAIYRSMTAIEDGKVIATHRQSVLSEADVAAGFTPGDTPPPVVDTHAAGRIGLMAGREALSPAVAAALRQRDANLLAWCTGHEEHQAVAIAQTRAWEQRIPVVVAGSSGAGATIAGPRGELLAVTHRGMPMLTHASVTL